MHRSHGNETDVTLFGASVHAIVRLHFRERAFWDRGGVIAGPGQ